MDKTLAYWIEKTLGIFTGILFLFIAYQLWFIFSFVAEDPFLDKLITISTTLFGFLLTILTIIVQSVSETIIKMKTHGSYVRLIRFNKSIVILSATVCLLSLLLIFTNEKFTSEIVLQIISLINFAFFIWTIVDTVLFVLIFYKILQTED